jgi:hypothetical protein
MAARRPRESGDTNGTRAASRGAQSAVALEKIRPELNLEKWAIWELARAKGRAEVKILERQITGQDGSKLTARVKRGITDLGTTTTEDQKIYYALTRIFEENGRSEGPTAFSLRQIAKILKKKWGTNVITSITNSLLRLRQTPFTWNNSYYDSTTGQTIKLLDTFNILSELKLCEREHQGVSKSATAIFRFNSYIEKNLVANHTKPLILDAVISFKSDLAQVLYTHLDTIMADKVQYERRTKELFEDLGLRGKAYKNLSDRKRQLQKALKELAGIPISTGVITAATLEKTKDGPDYKAVFKKDVPTELVVGTQSEGQPKNAAQNNNAPDGSADASSPNPETEGDEARLLVLYFYQSFHNVEKASPSKKELEHARDLISKYGFERAKYVVEYSVREAPKTKYKPAVFGGIVHYAPTALAEYDKMFDAVQSNSEFLFCEFCSYSPGFRYVEPDNQLRRCTHKTEVESKYVDSNKPLRAEQVEVSGETDPEASDLWSAVLEKLCSLLGSNAVETWLGKSAVRPLRIEDDRCLVLKPANLIVTEWVSENFSDVIKSALMEVSGTGEPWTLEFVAPDDSDFALP